MSRFQVAMSLFGALAVLAAVTLTDEKVRAVTLALLAMFAVRTWLLHRKQQQEAARVSSRERE